MVLSSKPMGVGLVSRIALGAALALGVVAGGTLTETPAAAKEKEPKPVPLKMTPAFQKIAGPFQKALGDAKARADVTAAAGNAQALAAALAPEKAQLDQLFAAIGNEDDKYVAGTFALQLGGMASDQSLQRRGLGAMLESGKSQAGEVPKLNFYAGQLAYVAKDYPGARAYLEAAIKGGFTENDPQLMLAETYMSEGNIGQGLALLQQAIDQKKASGGVVPESWYRRGMLAAYKAKSGPQASTFAMGLVQSYPTTQNWGIAITIIREIGGIPAQEMVDLLRLMGRTNSYNEMRDYLEYIEAADPRRLPGEVLKVIEAGTASGKLNPSDRTVAEIKAMANERVGADRASLPALERDARAASSTAVTALASGDAFLSYGDAAKAEALYAIALGKPGVDQPRALTRLGIAQVDQGKYAEAQATFAKITGPRKPIADLWTAYAQSKAKGGV